MYLEGLVSVIDSTVYGNQATYNGGGIAFVGSGTTGLVYNSTIVSNSVTGVAGSGAAGVGGGGIYNSYDTVTLFSTIVAGNSALLNGPDLGGSAFTDGRKCLIVTICRQTPSSWHL